MNIYCCSGVLDVKSVFMKGFSYGVYSKYKGRANPKETNIANMLKGCGYMMACVGKWHLGHQKKFLPTSQAVRSLQRFARVNGNCICPKMVSNDKKKSGVHTVVAELYDLSTDTSKSNNVAFVNPGVVNELTEAAEASDKELRLDSREPGKVKE